ncbi:hypothetical protein AtNW77_Chr1g0042691 [Arabidopsis thaliana]
MGVGTYDGPLFIELKHVMDISKEWSYEKRLMVGRLCLLSVGVHGIYHGCRILLSSAKLVLDPKAFEKYLWGRVAFESLVISVKIVWVRHMIPVSEENMYRKWNDLSRDQHMTYDNLIRDIIHNNLRNNAWKHAESVRRRKRKESRNEDGENSVISKGKER